VESTTTSYSEHWAERSEQREAVWEKGKKVSKQKSAQSDGSGGSFVVRKFVPDQRMDRNVRQFQSHSFVTGTDHALLMSW